ncbi:MAG: hypothetical protein ACRC4L_02420, partial [Mycoplasma sp.]
TTGKKLTELELIHSYVWTLDVNNLTKKDFSRKFKGMIEYSKKIKTKSGRRGTFDHYKLFEIAFDACIKCNISNRNIDEELKGSYNIFSQLMKKSNNNDLSQYVIKDWFNYCEEYINLNFKYNQNTTLSNNDFIWKIIHAFDAFNKINRKEFLSILAFLSYENKYRKIELQLNERVLDLVKIISYCSFFSHEYFKLSSNDNSKFNSEDLKFDKILTIYKERNNYLKSNDDVNNILKKEFNKMVINFINCVESGEINNIVIKNSVTTDNLVLETKELLLKYGFIL